MKDAGPVVKTHHPFGDPAATQYNQRDELMRELQRRATNPHIPVFGREPRDPLAPVSGEIAVPVRHAWTAVAAILFVVALAGCVAVAMLA